MHYAANNYRNWSMIVETIVDEKSFFDHSIVQQTPTN